VASDAELIGGAETRAIVVVDYDSTWPSRFLAEHERIARALRDVPRRIEHVGSTAVPGLAAKPIVDIQVSVPDVADEASYLSELEATGYVLRVREHQHRMLRTPTLDVHVHVCSLGGPWERRHLLFRDWLRQSAVDRNAYEQAKRELATGPWPTMDDYADAKTPIIAEITTRAEEWALTTSWSVVPLSSD
jgi:GrpB-like predicted nucleotidyltransferase (UPF0157 family)